MALKNFAFKENRVGSEVAGMKIAFFAIFDRTRTTILALKDPKMDFLLHNSNFQSL